MWGCQKYNLMGMQKLGGKTVGDYGLERGRESSNIVGSGFREGMRDEE
jgi:hypothetical protein